MVTVQSVVSMKCDEYVMKLVPRTIMITIGTLSVDHGRRRRRNVPIEIEASVIDVVASIVIMDIGVRIAYRRRGVNRREDIVHLLKGRCLTKEEEEGHRWDILMKDSLLL